jgi:LysM repeat protein
MGFRSGRAARAAAGGLVAGALFASPAKAAVTHVVQPGETLWSIAAANNLTTRTVAVYNGFAEDAAVVVGQTVQVPTVAEGSAALAPVPSTTEPATSELAASEPVPATAGGHVVQPGESLTSVAAAHGVSLSALAAANGLAVDGYLYVGQSLQIPERAAATAAPAGAVGYVPSPHGELPLDSAAASSWNAMRERSLRDYGQDIYPGGPLSALRTYEQQAYLYDLYLSGQGEPANPPGTSSHERGTSVDVETPDMRSVIDRIGWEYGWGKLEAPTEWWHVSYAGG